MGKGKYSILILVLIALLTACGKKEEEVRLRIEPAVVELEVGKAIQLQLVVTPADASTAAVQWTIDNPEIATLVGNTVLATAPGYTTIHATLQGSPSAQCALLVTGPAKPEDEQADFTNSRRYLSRSPKRGMGMSYVLTEDIHLLAPAVSWVYNWGSAPADDIDRVCQQYDIDFCPMAWNGGFNKEKIAAYKAAHPKCRYILGYNEPNLTDQCNMTPSQAAEEWPRLKHFADSVGLQIVAPAMNYGTLPGYSDPIVWLDEFFSLVPKSDVCALALHCYMNDAASMLSFIDRFDKYDLPIWMTEFCVWSSSLVAQQRFMADALPMMEADPRVERYAWFLVRGELNKKPFNQLVTKSSPIQLSVLGQEYVGLPTLDNTIWLDARYPILMNTCCEVTNLVDDKKTSPHFVAIEDGTETLCMDEFLGGHKVVYQIEADREYTGLRFRYRTYFDSEVEILVDDNEPVRLTMKDSGFAFTIAHADIHLTPGKHRLTLRNIAGNCSIHWMKWE